MNKEDKHYEQIWNDFKAGQHSAFTLIYNQHIDALYAYGTKICNDNSLVKDCIQDVFIKLFEKRDQIRNLHSIKYYLFKLLKNSIIDNLSHHRKMKLVSENVEFNIEYSAEKNWIDKEIDRSQKTKIKNALSALTSKQKEIIYLRYNQGLSFEQIGEIMNVNAGSAKKQTYRTLGKLRELLHNDGQSQSQSDSNFKMLLFVLVHVM